MLSSVRQAGEAGAASGQATRLSNIPWQRQVRVKHAGIVRGKRDGETFLQKRRKGMIGQRGAGFARSASRARSCRELLVGQFSSTTRLVISHSARAGSFITAMPCPMRSAPSNSTASRTYAGPPISPAWQTARKPGTPGKIKRNGEVHRGQCNDFIAAHAEGDHAQRLEFRRPAGCFHRGVRSKLTHAIKNQSGAQMTVENAIERLANRGDIRFHILHAPQHHSDRNGELCVNHFLANQFLREMAGDESVILGFTEVGGDPFERCNEAVKIRVGVPLDNFFPSEAFAVARVASATGRFGANRSLEMEMEFGLRKFVNDRSAVM